MKEILAVLILMILFPCHISNTLRAQGQDIVGKTKPKTAPLILPASLENRRTEFEGYRDAATRNIEAFAKRNGWSRLTGESFFDSLMIFDDKKKFNRELLLIAGADTSMELPETFCAALENRVLLAVTPEYYSRVYPEGVEKRSYEKLLTHEIAHRLHIRILNGDEEAMGPVWFYEGFATYAADQFTHTDVRLNKEEMAGIMNDPDRGSYRNYNFIFRYFVNKVPLEKLISKAGDGDFNEWLLARTGR